jgi:hypothetical protein
MDNSGSKTVVVKPRKKSASEQVKQIYQRNKLLFRYACPSCNKKTYYHHVMQNHIETKKHALSKKEHDQNFDYISYKKTHLMEEDTSSSEHVIVTVESEN